MNILMLSDVSAHTVIGGAERMMRGQCDGLSAMGHNVSLIVRAPVNDRRTTVEFNDIIEHRYQVKRTTPVEYLATTIKESSRKFDILTKRKPMDAVMVHQSLSGLGPIMQHKNACKLWLYACYSLAHEEYKTRNPIKPGLFGILSWHFHSATRRLIEKTVIRRCDKVLVLSEFMRARVIKYHRVDPQKIVLIPGAADT
ncbi:MAG: glycosyltransferase, partial [Lentisphaerae bacterium]|nr:glycosyltransferase [Lentisphaerota bacterium]